MGDSLEKSTLEKCIKTLKIDMQSNRIDPMNKIADLIAIE